MEDSEVEDNDCGAVGVDNGITNNDEDIADVRTATSYVTGHVGSVGIHYITLANQLITGREGGFLLSDPHGFLYRFNKTVSDTKYYFCVRRGCPGRCSRYRRCYGLDSEERQFFRSVNTTADDSEFVAFRSERILQEAASGRIVLEIDGTFSVVPNEQYGGKRKFDKSQQLLMIHYRFRGRNYLIGYFLTNSMTENAALDMLRLVDVWLDRPNTHVERVISDHDVATQNAARATWNGAVIQSCALHISNGLWRIACTAKVYTEQ